MAAEGSWWLGGSRIGCLARPAEEEQDERQAIRDLEAREMSL